MGDLVVVAPVRPMRQEALREHLRGIERSPLAGLAHPTHFARFVVVPLDGPRLLFSSRFDAEVTSYIAALADSRECAAIWSHCESADDLSEPAHLRRYLTRHRVKSPYLLAAWSGVSVDEVNTALDRHARLSGLAVESGELDAIGLAHAFRERFSR